MAENVNPFASPLSDESALRPPPEEDWEDQRGRGPLAMLFIGGMLGGALAALAGAMGAAALGLTVGIREPNLDIFALAFIGAMIGGIWGGLVGIVVGAILGVIAGFQTGRFRRRMKLISIGISLLVGGAFGFVGGAILSGVSYSIPLGILCGCTSGAAGGWLLARLLTTICWGRAPTR